MADDKEARRKALQAELEALDQDDEVEYEYEIGWGDKYWRGSSKSAAGRKIAAFFEGSGIDLAAEAQDDDDQADDDKDAKKDAKKPAGRQQAGGNVRAFRGRGVS